MTWRLQFDEAHKVMDYFDQCDNLDEQMKTCNELIKKYTDPQYSPIEIGVDCAKYGENWKVLDPFDKRDLVDYRFGLDDVIFHRGLHGKFDFVKANAIFEHVMDPFACSEGVWFLLKQGGIFLGDFPFAFPYHPFKGYKEEVHGILQNVDQKKLLNDEMHGGDYWRYTPDSIRILFRKFEIIKLEKTKAGSFLYIGRKI